MKKIFLFLALVLLIPFTAMAADASNLKDSKWVTAIANQENLWDMDLAVVTRKTVLVELPGSGIYVAPNSRVKNFLECYNFSENGKLQGILLVTDKEKIHQEMEKELIRSLGTPMRIESNQAIWIKGPNGIVSFFEEKSQVYIIAIMDPANLPKKSK